MKCPVCASTSLAPFLDLGEQPVFCNVQWATRAEAVAAPKARLNLNSCRACGHVFNIAFDPEKVAYAPGYENSQHFSSVFRAYAHKLVARLVERFDVRNKVVVDIGCGRGDLLRMIAKHGHNRGFGFDPSYDAVATAPDESDEVKISREFFTREHAKELQPSLVCCRHVLEHVGEPVEFLEQMRQITTGASTPPVFYLEVPNGTHLLRTASAWDYIYEHVSYFSRESLALALERGGFDVIEIHEDFDGQFLCAYTRPRQVAGAGVGAKAVGSPQALAVVDAAAVALFERLEQWRAWAAKTLEAGGDSTTIWGAGSKGVLFLNILGIPDSGPISWIIDQSPLKHGRYVSGTGHVIARPDREHLALGEVVLMNSIYAPEVRVQLVSNGSRAQLLAADGAPYHRAA